MSEKARENRLRRRAKRLGLWLKKSRAKQWSLNNRMGYTLIDPYSNTCVWGPEFNESLTNIENDLDNYEAKLRGQKGGEETK